MTEAATEYQPNQIQYIAFILDHERYCISVIQVQEILREIEATPVPGAPDFIIGILNLRGNVVSVIDMRARLKLPTVEPTELSRIIVFEVDNQIVGMLVDQVSEVIDVDEFEIEPYPQLSSDATSIFIDGVVCRENKITMVLSATKLLMAKDSLELA